MMDHNSQHSAELSTWKWTLSNPRSTSEKHRKFHFQLGADTFRPLTGMALALLDFD